MVRFGRFVLGVPDVPLEDAALSRFLCAGMLGRDAAEKLRGINPGGIQ
jgi:hypothetical protein